MGYAIYEIYEMVLQIVFCALMTASAWEDRRERRIPDRLAGAVAVLGIWKLLWKTGVWVSGGLPFGTAGRTARGAAALAGHVFDSLGGAALGAGIFLVILLIWPGSFGGGDVKLLTAGGVFLGLERTAAAFGMSVLLAGGACLTTGKWNTVGRAEKEQEEEEVDNGRGKGREIAFGPFLGAGMILSCFWGEALWQWYVG